MGESREIKSIFIKITFAVRTTFSREEEKIDSYELHYVVPNVTELDYRNCRSFHAVKDAVGAV